MAASVKQKRPEIELKKRGDGLSCRIRILRAERKPDGSYLKYPDGRRVKEWQLVSSYYRCKNDQKGVVYDKKVMLYVSRQLEHNRISVIAGHYNQGKITTDFQFENSAILDVKY